MYIYRKILSNQKNISIAIFSQWQNNIEMPKLSIETSNGDRQHFTEFWDSFRYSVHENHFILNV